MSLKDVEMTSVLRRLAERRIEDAMKEGKFDNLRGKGQPLVLEPMPADENARLMWWALRILRNNEFTPEEVRWRKRIETMKADLELINDEHTLRTRVAQINLLAKKLNTLGTNAMTAAAPVAGVSVDIEIEKLRARNRND